MKVSRVPDTAPRKKEYINRNAKVISFGADNLYPQRVKRVLEASPTALACRNLFCRFVKGDGFTDERLSNAVINPRGQRVFQLLNQLVRDFANHGYFAVHINYNLLAEAVSFSRIEPTYIRLGKPDTYGAVNKIAIWDCWDGKNYTNPDPVGIDYIDTYHTDPERVLLQIDRDGGIQNYKGQVYLYTGDELTYPLPLYDSVLQEMLTEEAIGRYNYTVLEKGFMAKHVITYAEEMSKEQLKQNKRSLQSLTGPEGDTVTIIHGVGDNGVNIHALKHNHTDNMFGNTEDAVRAKIMRAWGQNPILHGDFRPGSLGQSTEIVNAFEFYNLATRDYRDIFKRYFKELFSRFAYDISEDYSITELTFNAPENGNNEQLGTE